LDLPHSGRNSDTFGKVIPFFLNTHSYDFRYAPDAFFGVSSMNVKKLIHDIQYISEDLQYFPIREK